MNLKHFLYILLISMCFIITANAGEVPSTIDYQNNTITAEDDDIKFVTDYKSVGSGYIYPKITYKTYTGYVDAVFGFDTNNVKPTDAWVYNPHEVQLPDTQHTETFYYVSNIRTTSEEPVYGNEYNTYRRKINHKVPDELGISWIDIYDTVIAFDSYQSDGTNYTVSWHTHHSYIEDWTKIPNSKIEIINYTFDNKTKWYLLKEIPISAGTEYKLKVKVNAPPQIGLYNYKYDFATKRSADTIQEAIQNDRLKYIDPWWNTSWSKKLPLFINNTGGNILTDYQILVNVTYDSDMQNDFGDVRFINETSDTEISYWIENKVDGSYANFWINLTYIPGSSWTNSTYYLYYGNLLVDTTSDGNNTFSFFDDFLGSSLDLSKWNNYYNYGAGGVIDISGSIFKIKAASSVSGKGYKSTTNLTVPYIYRCKGKMPSQNYGAYIGLFASTNTNPLTSNQRYASIYQYSSNDYTSEANGITGSSDGVDFNNSNLVTFEIKRNVLGESDFYANNSIIDNDHDYSTNLSSMIVFIAYRGETYNEFDWVLIRKYATVEPDIDIGIEESQGTVYLNITLDSQTPTTLNQSSTGYITQSFIVNHTTGLNYTSLAYVYSIWDQSLNEYKHRLRPPDNTKATLCPDFNEWILRADNRNETLTFENNATITGGNIYNWSGADYYDPRITITDINSTHTYVNITDYIRSMVYPSVYYLDRTDMFDATKTNIAIDKSHSMLIKIWDGEAIYNHEHLLYFYVDGYINPAQQPLAQNRINIYYLNESFNPLGTVNPEDSPHLVFVGSMNATQWNTAEYIPQSGNSYVNGLVINSSTLESYGIHVTPNGYFYLTSNTATSKPYYLVSMNGASSTNRTFAQTNVMWRGTTAPYTATAYTPNTFVTAIHENQYWRSRLYIADNNSNWANSSYIDTAIGKIDFVPSKPTIEHFVYYGVEDNDMNGTYNGTFDITIGLSNDPDGGIVTHNLTLLYANRTYVATINNTVTSAAGPGLVNISFNSVPYYSQDVQYTLRLIATDDESNTRTTYLGTNFTLSNAPLITSYTPETPYTSYPNENITFTIHLNQLVNVTWYLDGTQVYNETNVSISNYTNSNASIGAHNVTASVSNINGTDVQTWAWTVRSLVDYIPIELFNYMAVSGILFVILGLLFSGVPGVLFSFVAMIINAMMSKIVASRSILQDMSDYSSVFQSGEYSYLFMFMVIACLGILIYKLLNIVNIMKEVNTNQEVDTWL